VLSSQEFRDQADQCIDRAGTARSAGERKLYLRLALTWLEIVIRMERRTIELRDADAAAFGGLNMRADDTVRTARDYVRWSALALACLTTTGVGALIYFFPLTQFLESFAE